MWQTRQGTVNKQAARPFAKTRSPANFRRRLPIPGGSNFEKPLPRREGNMGAVLGMRLRPPLHGRETDLFWGLRAGKVRRDSGMMLVKRKGRSQKTGLAVTAIGDRLILLVYEYFVSNPNVIPTQRLSSRPAAPNGRHGG